jgi:hypothetical protein
MKLEGRISILIGREGTRIEIKDEKSAVTFVEVNITPDQLSAALSRQALVECELEVRGLDCIGKKHENKTFSFEIPDSIDLSDRWTNDSVEKELQKYAQSLLSDGWMSDGYFRSQNSFFEKDGKKWARVKIRRWV